MSITDVAKHANVSIATVSRFINGDAYVAEATAARIRKSMQELGYVPRALRPGPKQADRKGINTGNIMLLSLMTMAPADLYRMPAFPALLGGVQQGLTKRGMNLLLAHSPTAP